MKKLLSAAAAASVLAMAGSAQGATVFSDRATFLAAVGSVIVETFEKAPFATAKSYDVYDGDGFTLDADNAIWIQDSAFNSWSDWGSGDIAALPYNTPLVITFDAPVHAFGIDLMTYVPGRPIQVSSSAYGGTIGTASMPNRTFFGFTSNEAFTSVTLHSTRGYLLFDNLTVGGLASAAPEPSSWALMILGIGGVGVMLRRSRGGSTAARA